MLIDLLIDRHISYQNSSAKKQEDLVTALNGADGSPKFQASVTLSF